MPHLENFTVYSDDLDSGDVIKNDTTIIDNKGSVMTDYTSIFNVFDKVPEDETRVLVGQAISNTQYIRKEPQSTRYTLLNYTFFFKNGSINVEKNTFNWIPGTIGVATIIYGTGKYLGATGYAQFVNKKYAYDECKGVPLFRDEVTFLFTN